MSESELIKEVILQLLGPELAEQADVWVLRQDEVTLSLQWRIPTETRAGSAKVLKLEDGWKLLHHE